MIKKKTFFCPYMKNTKYYPIHLISLLAFGLLKMKAIRLRILVVKLLFLTVTNNQIF